MQISFSKRFPSRRVSSVGRAFVFRDEGRRVRSPGLALPTRIVHDVFSSLHIPTCVANGRRGAIIGAWGVRLRTLPDLTGAGLEGLGCLRRVG